jgi:hypothetical protein
LPTKLVFFIDFLFELPFKIKVDDIALKKTLPKKTEAPPIVQDRLQVQGIESTRSHKENGALEVHIGKKSEILSTSVSHHFCKRKTVTNLNKIFRRNLRRNLAKTMEQIFPIFPSNPHTLRCPHRTPEHRMVFRKVEGEFDLLKAFPNKVAGDIPPA